MFGGSLPIFAGRLTRTSTFSGYSFSVLVKNTISVVESRCCGLQPGHPVGWLNSLNVSWRMFQFRSLGCWNLHVTCLFELIHTLVLLQKNTLLVVDFLSLLGWVIVLHCFTHINQHQFKFHFFFGSSFNMSIDVCFLKPFNPICRGVSNPRNIWFFTA